MANKPHRILVTGGCGFVGSEVVKILIDKGYSVVVADNLSNPQSSVKPGYDFHQIDIGDLDAARRAFTNVDACIALASQRGAIGYVHRNPTAILSLNNQIYHGTFQAAAEAEIQRIVFISSSMVYESASKYPTGETDLPTIPIPRSIFAFSKLMGEQYCRAYYQQYGLPYSIIRPSNIYGINELPGSETGDTHVIPELFKKIVSGQYPVELLGDGRQTRCFIHVTDIARGIVTALENEAALCQDFNMGSPDEVSIFDLAVMIWEYCHMTKAFRSSSAKAFPQDVQRQFMNIDKAKTLLDWHPRIPFEEGLREVVEWLSRESVL